MNTFANKLDTLSDNFQSELDKLHKAIREEIEEYIKDELKEWDLPSGLEYEIEYYCDNIRLHGEVKHWVLADLENDLNTLDHSIKQAFEKPLSFNY